MTQRTSSILVDFDDGRRTGWVQPEFGRPGKFIGDDAAAAAAAVRAQTVVEVAAGHPLTAGESSSAGALAAIVACANGSEWTLVQAPEAWQQLLSR